MDIFKFNNPTAPTLMEQGEIINGLTSKMWIERYAKEGEFTFVAPSDSGIREKLPIGSFVSHINTTEIMVVENHEISDDKGSTSDITITGRGMETFLESRIVGSNNNFPTSGTIVDFFLPADYIWNQIVTLINNHINITYLLDDNNSLPYTTVISDILGSIATEDRFIQRGTVYERVLDLLNVDNLGIKVVRPGPWSPLTAGSSNVAFVIHKGMDRSSDIVLSYDAGEIESSDYLWSNKKFRNAALVTGKWVETVVLPAAVGYDRRMMYVSATDIDQDFTGPPSGADLTNVVSAMQNRGLEALIQQFNIVLTKAQVSKESIRSIYRTDFNVGDVITVSGDYNEVIKMRVTEYVEVEDDNGENGYPTLAIE